jgi:hypothetical protein
MQIPCLDVQNTNDFLEESECGLKCGVEKTLRVFNMNIMPALKVQNPMVIH